MNHLKKAVAISLAAATLSTCAVAAYAAEFEKGDINHDGVLDSDDALLILRSSIGTRLLSQDQLELADFNNDGVVDSCDALMILRQSVAKDTEPLTFVVEPSRTQVSDMEGWSAAEVVEKVGPLFTEDQRKTGILASVSMAQFIVESGYGQSRLSLEANNCFGIKGYPGGTYSADTPWDGVSLYTISTKEYDSYGNPYYIDATFRQYDCMEDSIADHSRVLMTSSDGTRLRYAAVVGVTDYRKAAQIIFDGGYCTAPDYVDLLCRVIENWDLTQYDLPSNAVQSYNVSYSAPVVATDEDIPQELYRVRLTWEDAASQIGAYHVLDNAIEWADSHPGYNVYDEDGDVVYSS